MWSSTSELINLAKSQREQAELELLAMINALFPPLCVSRVIIQPSKVSLNSVTGMLYTANEQILFFKFHAEQGEEMSLAHSEMYQASRLRECGYPVIEPVYASAIPGRQILIYEFVTAPTVFELLEQQETCFQTTGSYQPVELSTLLAAERCYARKQSQILLETLVLKSAAELANSAIHQLFWHRLATQHSQPPRVQSFYAHSEVRLPGDKTMPFSEMSRRRWVINGVSFNESLSDLIEQAKQLLKPASTGVCPAVFGHGDDHNGNKFLIDNKIVLFDPAFADWHPALLSLIKPLAHNVLVHPFWLYDPESTGSLRSNYQMVGHDKIVVTHNWNVAELSPVRLELLEIYITELWGPLLRKLQSKGWLASNWQSYLQKALFCCPFLVTNLLDASRYSPENVLLNLARCVEIGSTCKEPSLVAAVLERMERELSR